MKSKAIYLFTIILVFYIPAQAGDVSHGAIVFDQISAKDDVGRIKKLPLLIQKRIQTIGTKYSLFGGRPQPYSLNTAIQVVFSPRVYDFTGLESPVDMGHCFSFTSAGRAIFECGSKGFIRFAARWTEIENIAFVGPRNNVPPLIVYSQTIIGGKNTDYPGEPAGWYADWKKAPKTEAKAWGRDMDGGYIHIRNCWFKGFSVAFRTRLGQHTASAQAKFEDCTFHGCGQLSDNIVFDMCIIESSWLCPVAESDKAFIVNRDALILDKVLAVPLADTGNITNARWIDNYGNLTIKNSRFGNELINFHDPLDGQQMSLVYNYTKFASPWINAEKTHQLDSDQNFIIIKDNSVYSRNVPMVKFFNIPNHVVITGNTGLIGSYKTIKDGRTHNKTYLCEFVKPFSVPPADIIDEISINISDNQKRAPLTKENPKKLGLGLDKFRTK